MSGPQSGEPSAPLPPRTYKLMSAAYRDKNYSEGLLLFDSAKRELELRQVRRIRRKNVETVIARFRVEPAAQVGVNGAVLKVSELSVTLESPSAAGEIAELLKRPEEESKRAKDLSEAESSVDRFLEERETMLSFFSHVRSDPRGALFGARTMWPADDSRKPMDAIYSAHSERLAESLKEMKAALAAAEPSLGLGIVDRLYALAYTVGAVQDALFAGGSDLAQELSALQELGISTTAQDLRLEKSTQRLVLQAHPALEALATSSAPTG